MNKNNQIKVILIMLSAITLFSCANSHPYDPNNPDDYRKHWENNEKIKDNELIYPFSEECKEEKRKGKSCRPDI